MWLITLSAILVFSPNTVCSRDIDSPCRNCCEESSYLSDRGDRGVGSVLIPNTHSVDDSKQVCVVLGYNWVTIVIAVI